MEQDVLRAGWVMPQPMVKILAVDDVPQNLIALKALISRPDVEMLEARSGNDALELLLVHDVALALVDVQMPGMDGFELAELMRGSERSRNVPIIFLTAHSPDPGRIFQGYEAGAVDFLSKPLNPDLLRTKIDVFVQLHRQKLELAQHAETLEQMLRLSDIFIGVLGHDLRNPLTGIRTGVDVLLRRPDLDESAQNTLKRVRRASDRMGRLIQQLLDFARARISGGIPIERTHTDVGELVHHAVAELEEGPTSINVSLQGNLKGEWDPDRLLQVVSNLVGNALQHGKQGNPVEVHVESRPDSVEIEVRNSGEIPSELLKNLFDPFRRLRAPTTERVGLGLYIVDQIVRSHGGAVTVSSSAESGTSVKVTLPRTPPPREPPAPSV